MKRIDLIGQRFGALTVQSYVGGKSCVWRCKCDCGKEFITEGGGLRYGRTVSCGCQKSERIAKSKLRHGHASRGKRSTPTYSSWMAMRRRCYDVKNKCFHLYGGRGEVV